MKLRFWGVRGSTPTPSLDNFRYGGNTPCVEVRTARGELLILDCGPYANVIRFIPPLSVSMTELDQGIDILEAAIAAYEKR